MKALVIPAFGLDRLELRDVDAPEPGPGQALLRMTALSLNFRDLLVAQGLYNPRLPLPLVPISDGVGEVIAVGSGVRRVRVGDRVMPQHVLGWTAGVPAAGAAPRGGPHPGLAAERALVDADDLVHVPAHLTDEEGATLACAGVTAWNALFGLAQTRPGERVLVLGTGGVALFAAQFAKLAGAEVAITSGSDEKLERARAIGADHGINYARNPAWSEEVLRLFPGGADRVIELGGGATLEQSLRSVRRGGDVMLVGSVTGGVAKDVNLIPVFMRAVRMQGVAVGARDQFEAMAAAMGASGLRPVVSERRQGLDSVPAALASLSDGMFGKSVVTL